MLVIFAVMCVPMALSFFKVRQARPLSGGYEKAEKPKLTLNNWLDRGYQDSADRYVKLAEGAGPAFTRLGNQIRFSLFKSPSARFVIVGKDNFLYEENYIHTYYGEDYIGQDSISKTLDKLKFLQDTLHRLGHELVVLLCPGKGAFYPEYIPDKLRKPETTRTNMLGYVAGLPQHHINHIDFYTWFLGQKHRSPYPLFPKYGTHWSNYAEFLVADSISHYLGALMHRPMPRMTIKKIEMSSEPQGRDDDIAQGLNLWKSLEPYPMAYVKEKQIDTAAHMPAGLVIADSFFWGGFGMGLNRLYFGDTDFWYYNEDWHRETGEPKKVSDLDLSKELQSHEVILIMFTDANAYRAGFGFIENACRVFHYPGGTKQG